MVYPVRQRWFASRTQMANEPTYVDEGERISSAKIYYHAGLDIGGAEGLVDVLAATDGLVVGLGAAVADREKNNSSLDHQYNDTIWVQDGRGWYHRYTHLHSFDPSVKLGGRVVMGQKIGTLGKEGGSGGWSHLHYEILSRQASGKLGTQEGYAFLWEAYRRQYKPHLIAVARPHQAILVGDKAMLDGSQSWSDSHIARYEWTFTDGENASGPRVEKPYSKSGTFSEILKITDDHGRAAYDFETVNVLDPNHPERVPPSIQAAHWPATDLVLRRWRNRHNQVRWQRRGARQKRIRRHHACLHQAGRLHRACGALEPARPEGNRSLVGAGGRHRLSSGVKYGKRWRHRD